VEYFYWNICSRLALQNIALLERDGSLPLSQEPQCFSPLHTVTPYFCKIGFNFTLPSTSRSHKWPLRLGFPTKILCSFFSEIKNAWNQDPIPPLQFYGVVLTCAHGHLSFFFPMLATCSTLLIVTSRYAVKKVLKRISELSEGWTRQVYTKTSALF